MRRAIAAAALAVIWLTPAFAGHGKAGLWKVTVTVGGPTAPAVTPAERAQLAAHGINMAAPHTMTADHCMSAAEAASDRLQVASQQPGCSLEAAPPHGNTYGGVLVCSAEPKGRGQLQITYADPEHYTGSMVFKGEAEGHPLDVVYHYAGLWVSPDCGNVHH